MKNLQALLIATAFASMMPSATVLCSEEVTVTPSEESAEASTPPRVKVINQSNIENSIKGALMLAIPFDGGVIGMFAGAAGSHSLKKVKRTLTKANSLTPETLIQLNKGIRNNRIGMAASLVLAASPIAVVTISAISHAKKQAQANDNLLKELNATNDRFESDLKELNKETSDLVNKMQTQEIHNLVAKMNRSTDKITSDLAKELNKETT